MGATQDHSTPCGAENCTGSKSTVYEYDDEGNCTSQSMFPCDTCGQ